ncbi:DNA polymerase I [Ruaniaceae bacterium KH17]|nr:DNA polymerase I [Ruaniaceae bacterium KH17]
MAFRAFFALPVDNFVTANGVHTNAIYGFLSMLVRLIQAEEPTHLAIAFDESGGTFRTEEYSDYKATRDATPEPFKPQVPLICEALDAMGVPWLSKENYEADDILATLAHQGYEQGMEVLVVSGDRDSFQFVNDRVTVLYPVKGVSELARMTPEAVEAKYGVLPDRYPELAALVGETSDNLPGVPGVGPKTAAKWLAQYDGLENLISRVDEVTGKAGESLRAHLDDVLRNRKLNHLLTDLDLPVGPKDLVRGPGDRAAVADLFGVLEFNQLRERVNSIMGEAEESAAPDPAAERTLTTNPEAWLAAVTHAVAVDVEGNDGDAWTVAVADSQTVAAWDLTEDASGLAEFLASDRPKILHDAKAAAHRLAARGIELNGVVFDTQLAAYLAMPGQRSYALGDLVARFVGRELAEGGDTLLDLGTEGSQARAEGVYDLAAPLARTLDEREASRLLTELELPVQRSLITMEAVGIAVDSAFFEQLEGEFAARVRDAQDEAWRVIGREVNLASPKQLQEVLFDELDMPKTKKTKTGYTTDAEALNELFAQTGHPFLEQLLIHRDQNKLRQTVETLRKTIADDGRIHTTFAQTVAATGRLSSLDPNLQNIPARTQEGLRIREGFVVGQGYENLMTADYSQIEMRIMAHLSGDEGLIEAFRGGEDLHRYVGSRVFGVATDDVTPEMRSKVKAMSYGLAYGLSAFGLSRQLHIDVAEARTLMDDYYERFGGVKRYLAGVVDQARRTGYTETIMGRRRYLPDLNSDNRQRRDIAERIALNAPIQGSAADIIKVAMIRLDELIAERGLASRMLLQVHDELVLEVAPGEQESITDAVREAMDGAADLAVPLDVGVGIGQNWRAAAH